MLEFYTGQALTGYLITGNIPNSNKAELVARASFNFAEAMVKEAENML